MRVPLKHRLDSFSVALIGGLIIALLGAGGVAVWCGILTLPDLFIISGVGVVLIAAHQTRQSPTPFRNTFAHGSARAAHESEALRAASGDRGPQSLDRHTFPD